MAKAAAIQICGQKCGKWRSKIKGEKAKCDMKPCAIKNSSKTECPEGKWTIEKLIQKAKQ